MLKETRMVDKPLQQVFDYAADFSNSSEWDPGVESSTALLPGPPAVGKKYDLVGHFGPGTIPMRYEVVQWEPTKKVVLEGTGEGFDSIDTMEFTQDGPERTRIDYTAEITLFNALRFLGPLMSYPLRRMGEEALDGLAEQLSR